MMEAVCGGAKPYMSTAHLENEHLRIKDKSMEMFIKKPKMGGEEFSKQYRDKLNEVNSPAQHHINYYYFMFLLLFQEGPDNLDQSNSSTETSASGSNAKQFSQLILTCVDVRKGYFPTRQIR